jgi:hypothetical protein
LHFCFFRDGARYIITAHRFITRSEQYIKGKKSLICIKIESF